MLGTQGFANGPSKSLPEMSAFITLDVNGWLDHLVLSQGEGEKVEERTLGFRSCLYKQGATWLFGAQALAAARESGAAASLHDAIDALASTAGHNEPSLEMREALPAALWQLVREARSRSDISTHLALVIPDGKFLGTPKVHGKTGKTALESLHDAFVDARPRELNQSRLELIWRSVAALKAAMTAGAAQRQLKQLGKHPGNVLVINVTRKTFWTVLELRPWASSANSKAKDHNHPICIVRSPVMDECNSDQACATQRVKHAENMLRASGLTDTNAIRHWTRSSELIATGMSSGSLKALGVNEGALEHWSWPTPEGGWRFIDRPRPSRQWPEPTLPTDLKNRLQSFADGLCGDPLAIVLETPAGIEMTKGLARSVRLVAPDIPLVHVTGRHTAVAAAALAELLGRDADTPAWLDEVPRVELEVRHDTDGGSFTKWMPIVAADKAIPAGETYNTPLDPKTRAVTLAPGVEHIHLHLRRGGELGWDERYSGEQTGHTILPSDHKRKVEPRARVRPLSGEARIEVVEHRPDGQTEVLAGSRSSIKWSDMIPVQPEALGSIPELFVFPTNLQAWNQLEPLLGEVVKAGGGGIGVKLKEKIYKCTQSQWKNAEFPLGSDGRPPQEDDPNKFSAAQRLLAKATSALQGELEDSVNKAMGMKPKVANRLHMPLTWLFTGCPTKTVEVLLNALVEPGGPANATLNVNNEWSAWSIYSGIGRSIQDDDQLRVLFDVLLGMWIQAGATQQDKFLLAAVTHPMARRVSVRRVLGESRQRFDQVKLFLGQQLTNLLNGDSDPRPGGTPHPSLELRYITMGYRGLCQVRYANPDWFHHDSKEAQEAHGKLNDAKRFGRKFENLLVERTAPYLIGEGRDPTMPGGF